MSSYTLNSNHDLDLTNNELTLTTGQEAIRQHLLVRFQLFKGEYFLDKNAGVPWYQDILKKNPDFVIVNEALKDTIIGTNGVTDILEFNLEFDAASREMSLDFVALTTDGVLTFDEAIVI